MGVTYYRDILGDMLGGISDGILGDIFRDILGGILGGIQGDILVWLISVKLLHNLCNQQLKIGMPINCKNQ